MDGSYYLFSSGELQRRDNSLTFETEDGTKKDIPIERVYDIYAFGSLRFNSALFAFLGAKGIPVHMFNYYEFYCGSFYPRETRVSGQLLTQQAAHYADPALRMKIAQEFVTAAAENIYRNLRYYNGRGKDVSAQMQEVRRYIDLIENTSSIQELMGCEGMIHRQYYEAFNTIIDQQIDFSKRVRRPPDNLINTLLSYCNSIMYTKVLSEIYHTQLNPTVSYLHEPGSKRFSLALDISEVFKPLIVDRLIFSMLNRNQITDDDLDASLAYLRIKEKGIRKIVEEFDKRMKQTITHKDLNREVSYQHLIRLECYKLIKHLMGEKPYEGFRIWW